MNFDRGASRIAMSASSDRYFAELHRLCSSTVVCDLQGNGMDLEAGFGWLAHRVGATHAAGNCVFFIGNGGSSSIASHQAIDYANNGGIRAQALNDSAALTCIGNDWGYEQVFCRQLEMHGRAGDLLIAVSSSGQSPSIVRAVEAARRGDIGVATFSGFRPENPLRRLGDINFYVAAERYGFVELAHLTLLHAILDLHLAPGRAG